MARGAITRRGARVLRWAGRALLTCALFGGLAFLSLWLAWGAAYHLLDRAYPLDFTRYDDRARSVQAADGSVLRAAISADGTWRFATSVAEVSPLYLEMLKAYEDRRFDQHGGVDPWALLRASGQMLLAGEVVSGASTLTMQVARLLEPRARTLESKVVEMFRAVQLERHFSKDEVLGFYLTLAPFGGNLEGVRAASLAYFGKEPRNLSPAEAALLVALPQSPTKLRPEINAKAAKGARDKVLRRVAEAGVISTQELAEALEAPVPFQRLAMPFLAPHLAEGLMASSPEAEVLTTTINAPLQANAEALAARAARQMGEGVTAALLVMNNESGAIEAYVGSADYFDAASSGMIDMTQAQRSPGSALKPFIYALAFERLIAHPDTLIADVPTRFGVYAPQNFDDKFHGEVTLREALQRSLNVPAVAVLDLLGPRVLDLRLQDVGVTLTFDRSSEDASLPIALGGAGISLTDLVRLYSALPNHGLPVEPRFLRDAARQPQPESALLTSDLAAWYVTRILEGAPRPPGFRLAESAKDTSKVPQIAFKTGTSYGYRDAWAVGYSTHYTIGVWIGRPDGAPCQGCIGLRAAAPLLFQVFALLQPEPAPSTLLARPAGAIDGPTAALPPALQRLKPGGPQAAPGAPPPVVIAFPLDGTTVELPRQGERLASLPLKVDGGLKPFTWLVNGAPLQPTRGQAVWQPDGPGFAEIKVIDAAGQSARAEIYIQALD